MPIILVMEFSSVEKNVFYLDVNKYLKQNTNYIV